RTDVVGGEAGEGVVDLVDQGEHGEFELALVGGLARREPGAVVVAGEGAEGGEGFRTKVRRHISSPTIYTFLVAEGFGVVGGKSASAHPASNLFSSKIVSPNEHEI